MTESPPAPPYDGYNIPERFRTVPYDQLPQGIRLRLERQVPPPEVIPAP